MQQDLVGISEIAEMANVTRQAVTNWRQRYDDFPKPAQVLQNGPVWNREIVEHWLKQKEGRTPHVISFINLKGGVAKTTTTVAVAELLAKEHRKHVLVIDLDPQTNATINLIKEEQWKELDEAGRTLAQLFEDKVNFQLPAKFNVEEAIVRQVSTIDGGIARLDLLPSSIKLIEIQERLPFVAIQGNYDKNPQDILKVALQPVIDRYDFVLIDCPPSLGVVTKNGLKISTGYIIPTIPDIVSTWGIFQIVDNVDRFATDLGRPIRPMGIVATKVQGTMELHSRVMRDLEAGRLFNGKTTELKQPPLFKSFIKQNVDTARGADAEANLRTFKAKYGPNCDAFRGLTQEIMERCNVPKR
ncbi:MAG TPA: ParA family protein [Verrucomicrobiota bacterium]|nr:ParA family protein [Verrucomicrobiota bacterium]HNU51122.1 ParA family protein [Verrucomicrobiota bacterium]